MKRKTCERTRRWRKSPKYFVSHSLYTQTTYTRRRKNCHPRNYICNQVPPRANRVEDIYIYRTRVTLEYRHGQVQILIGTPVIVYVKWRNVFFDKLFKVLRCKTIKFKSMIMKRPLRSNVIAFSSVCKGNFFFISGSISRGWIVFTISVNFYFLRIF